MKNKINQLTLVYFFSFLLLFVSSQYTFAQSVENDSYYDEALYAELNEDYENETISDPIEPFNRAMFYINDKLYFYVLKPVAKGYNFVLPEQARERIDYAFYNVRFPIRFVNDLLQAKFKYAGVELGRFVINSTVGLLGFFKPADKIKSLEAPPAKDTDLTFGKWGIGNGFYIVWPVFGPNTARSTFGLAGDFFLNPINPLLIDPNWVPTTIKAEEQLNHTSLHLGEYENVKENAVDPYVAVRNGYIRYRQNQLNK
jgi:phospholipid-binding lipoprotein MlaA